MKDGGSWRWNCADEDFDGLHIKWSADENRIPA